MPQKIIAGNWKMNGSRASIVALLETLKQQLSGQAHCETVVLAPFIYIPTVEQLLQGSEIAYGAQTLSEFEAGAYTGEVSAAMLEDTSCRYVLVGHSERRQIFSETDEVLVKKFAMAVKHGLTPILCVGETQDERDHGLAQKIVTWQLNTALDGVGAKAFQKAVIAYEPVWAIGTGKTATPEQAQEMHAFIRTVLAKMDNNMAQSMSLLYGGSVKASNAAALFAMPDIDGALVGGASLDVAEFVRIINAMRG
jgi:triosephosphate isomerase